jgi:evolutionarily conserved signaling intermediate in Toll pathway
VENPKEYAPLPTVHEQDDGNILALTITGSSSKDSLRSWIAFLSKTNPKLAQVPIVFRMRTLNLDSEVAVQTDQQKISEMVSS